ncbi:MAG: hypothetical protein AB1324_03035 [Candidatus Micrarchaeota archaeon]
MRRRDEGGENIQPAKVKGMVLGYLEERFGLGRELFSGYELYLASKGRVYLGPASVPPNTPIVTLGLMIARVSGSVKPSTNLLQSFGGRITRNAIELSREQTAAYCEGRDVTLEEGQGESTSDGFVLLKYLGKPLGCGHRAGNAVRNQLPKAKRLSLRFL